MKKRPIVLLVICLITLSCAFASHSVSLQASPYAIQKICFQTSTEYVSEYGWGVKAGYRYSYAESVFVGTDLSFSDYKYDETSSRYMVLSAKAKYGFKIPMNNFYMDVDMGAGVDLRIFDSIAKFYPSFGVYMGFGYKVSKKVELTAGTDLHVAWQTHETEDFSSVDTAIICTFGTRVNL
ncbi:MAG: outer membrane beta-barrel protein [Sphaerochaetaceae bacterium]|nr:outer membrane beta-barrel protein [Sphaerochaetaceae bacterium]